MPFTMFTRFEYNKLCTYLTKGGEQEAPCGPATGCCRDSQVKESRTLKRRVQLRTGVNFGHFGYKLLAQREARRSDSLEDTATGRYRWLNPASRPVKGHWFENAVHHVAPH
eukprot:scpid60819/ scgid13467/ 